MSARSSRTHGASADARAYDRRQSDEMSHRAARAESDTSDRESDERTRLLDAPNGSLKLKKASSSSGSHLSAPKPKAKRKRGSSAHWKRPSSWFEAGFLDEVSGPSFGVLKSEGAARSMNQTYRYLVFAGIAVASYAVSLDQYTATTYETQALATSFGQHSLIATVETVKAIMQSVSQPPFAKLCDIAGRAEAYLISVSLYTIGYAIVATSPSIGFYAAGTMICTLGVTGFWLINQVIVADLTPSRTRLFWSVSPSVLGTINLYVSGNVSQAILAHTSWRFGFALSCVLVPMLLSPVIFTLRRAQRRARELGFLDGVEAPWKQGKLSEVLNSVFWQVDAIGLSLMVLAFALILLPLTIMRQAGDTWSSAVIVVPMVLGAALLAFFVFYESRFARHPILPISLLRRRNVWLAFLLALSHPMANALQANYLFTWYRVSAGQSVISATRLNGVTGFTGTLTAVVVGVLVPRTRRLKPFIVFGAVVQTLALGLMVRFRGRANTVLDLASMQLLKGVGLGCISFPVQNVVQVASKHEHVALITASWLALFYISQAIGSAGGGAIWQATLPSRLTAALGGDAALAKKVYADPISWIERNGFDNPQRELVATAYSDAQRFLLYTAVGVGAVVIILALSLDNPELTDTITLPAIEEADEEEERPLERGNDSGYQVKSAMMTGRPEVDAQIVGQDDDDDDDEGSST